MAAKKPGPSLRDRIVELKRVPASELVPHPENWRRHEPGQQQVLTAMLAEIGFAGVVLTRRMDDGRLQVIDGHLRQKVAGDEKVPVVVTDLDENEARKLLATYDPLGAMAETDTEALRTLLLTLSGSADVAFQNVLDGVADAYDLVMDKSERFDATKLSGAVAGGTAPDGKAFVLYVSFRDAKEMIEAVNLLSGQNRKVAEGIHFTNIDGSACLDQWRTALLGVVKS